LKKGIIFCVLFLLVVFPFVFAIRGEIGNAKTVINTDWEEKKVIERTILVRNTNDVPVDITLVATAEIEDIIELIDDNFRLEVGEEKKARFDIVLDRPGEWQGKITVRFTPEEGNSVILASNLVIKAGAVEGVEIPDEIPEEEDEDFVETNEDLEEDDITGNVGFEFGGQSSPKKSKFSGGVIFLVVTLALVVVVGIAGGVYFLRK